MSVDFLIVGAGLSGCVFAERIATKLKKEVLIIDRRNHIGGNVYDYKNKYGINIHKYGPHIFHTNSEEVWRYLKKFTEWEIYFHKVLAVVNGCKIPVPFNLNSLYKIFPRSLAKKLEDKLIESYGFNKKVPILKLNESTDKDIKFLSQFIYEKVFLGYTIKQWGMKPEDLDKSVTARIPINISLDDRYFQDKYQGIPKYGYTNMIKNMIDNRLIKVELNVDSEKILKRIKPKIIIFTGPIDEYYNYKFGRLNYRSLEFEIKNFNYNYYQEVAQVNYPENYNFTRITEFKHFIKDNYNNITTVVFEFPQEYKKGENEPYYPILNEQNKIIYQKYYKIAQKEKNIIFVGRLAEYKYYNMDQIVARVLNLFHKYFGE